MIQQFPSDKKRKQGQFGGISVYGFTKGERGKYYIVLLFAEDGAIELETAVKEKSTYKNKIELLHPLQLTDNAAAQQGNDNSPISIGNIQKILGIVKNKNYYQQAEGYTGKKDLIAYHNISQTNLDKAIRLGGLAVSFIAITKKETDFSNFGTITLLMPQDVVNPKETPVYITPVYTRDTWTGVFPGILKASDEIEEEGEMGGFPGMEDMMGEGGGEEKRPPQMPKQTQDSAGDTGWRTLTNGVKVYIENGIITKGPKDLINKKLSDVIGAEFQHSDAPMVWVDAPTFYPQTYTKGHDKHHMEHAKAMGLTFREWLKEASDTLNFG